MGASGWVERVAWRAELLDALAAARAAAYARVPAVERARVEALSMQDLMRSLDLDPEDEETLEDWRAWVATAPPETRYVLTRGPDLTGSVLDVDHVEAVADAPFVDAPGLLLLAPTPELGGVRVPTDDELLAWFDTLRPPVGTDVDHVLDGMSCGIALAITTYGDEGPAETVFVGVTGD